MLRNLQKNQTRTNEKIYLGCRIQSEQAKSIAFLHVINKQLENKTFKNTINNSIKKSRGINQTKGMEDLYPENDETLLREMRQDVNEWNICHGQ